MMSAVGVLGFVVASVGGTMMSHALRDDVDSPTMFFWGVAYLVVGVACVVVGVVYA